MENLIKNWKRVLIRVSIILFTFIGLVILFISPITKYLIEKYDVKYTGREIKMDWAYVNPFTGYIHLSNFRMYENKTDNVFFSASGVSLNFSMLKLLSKTYEISSLTLDRPRGIIIQNEREFNFSDLIDTFSPKEKQVAKKEPLHFNILDIKIKDGAFYYNEKQTPINYFIKNVNCSCTGKSWDVDTISGKFSFVPGVGTGDISADFMINVVNLDYRTAVVVHKLDLGIVGQYLKELTNYGIFSANLDADIKAKGNFGKENKINTSGKMAINDFHFGKKLGDDYTSFKKMTSIIIELDPENHKYAFDSISLDRPFFKYERYDHLDNFQRMFGSMGSNVTTVSSDPKKFNLVIELARYIKVLFKNFLISDYTINSLAVTNGDLEYNDFSINEKFSAQLTPLFIKADSVDHSKKWVQVFLTSGIKPYGSLEASVKMNPKDNNDFDFNYKLQRIPAAAFNPYLISYTSFPLNRGTIEISGNWIVRNNIIQSTNHFIAIDPRIGERIRKKDTKWIPLPLIMSFVRERGNVIDYEIPITGDLKKPNFHFRDVILDLVKNIFIKPPTTPYRFEVKNTEAEIEKSISVSWPLRQMQLNERQERFIEKMADFLKENSDAKITVQPYCYSEKEKEYILFFEAKKKYFLAIEGIQGSSLTENDSIKIDKLSSKDPTFMKYLDKQDNDSMLFTIQEKCLRFVGVEIVTIKLNRLLKEREQLFMQFFKENSTGKQVTIFPNQNSVPFNGFSYFKINYGKEMPASLMDAYQKINQINTESFRKNYLKFRK